MKSSLRTKLLLSVGLIIFFVLGTSTFVHIQSLKRDYLEALAWRSEALAQSIVSDVVKRYNEYSPSPASFKVLLRSLSLQCIALYGLNKEKGVIHFAVIDSSGNIAAHNEKALWNTAIERPVLLEHLQRHEQTTVLDGTIYHTLIPMVGAEDVYLGTVSIGVPKSVVDQKVQQLLLNSSGLFGLFLVLAFFAVSVLVHVLIAKPISYLMSVGEKIARGEAVDIIRTTQDDRIMIRGKDISLGEIGELALPFHNIILYLQDMAHAATRIAAGDLRQEVTPRSDNDVLGTAFQRMSTYLRNMASVATAIADGDLRQTVQPNNEHDLLGNAFHKMKSLHHAISQIKDETDKVRNASASLSQVSVQMVSDAEQTSQRIQLVSSSSYQISESMTNVSTSTEEMSASIQEIARNTVDAMNVMTTAIQTVNAASTTLTDLETRSQEIGDIINVITMITQQTNLLALNATIEAARAGESGKGFAVVANEVKDLAREITISAKDITHKVEAMQSSTTIATEAITNVSEIIRQMNEISHSIRTAVEEQTAATNEISRNIADASHRSDEVTHVITDVATITQNTMTQAKSVQQAAEGLASFADQLQRLVGKFQVERE